MTGIRATYNPAKRTLKYSWPDGTYSIFEDLTEVEARAKTTDVGISLDISVPIADPFAEIVDVKTNDGWDA